MASDDPNSTLAETKKFVFELVVGDVLARPVFAKDGNILVEAGTVLSPERLNQLHNWNVEMVSIRTPEASTPDSSLLDDVVPGSDPAGAGAAGELHLAMGSLEAEEPIAWEELQAAPPPPVRPPEEIEKMVEEQARVRPPVTRVPAAPPPFQYDAGNVREAKKVVMEVHRRAFKETRRAISSIARRDSSSLDGLRKMVMSLVDTGLSNNQVIGALASLSNFDDFLLAHSVSTTVYSILTGYMMGLSQPELYELAECCLLHDIGMSRVPRAVWMKPTRLTPDEQIEIQKHTLAGADLLHDIRGVSFMAELVAYQHHERFDGTGYPKGRKGVGITEYSRIVGLVDVYAAMTSPRPYRSRILGYDAMRYILASSSTLFDPNVVKSFLRCMALYPVGSLVELSSGAVGVVVASNPLFPYRPHVKIMRDEKGTEAGADGDVIDLLKDRSIGITRQLTHEMKSSAEVWRAF